MSEPRPTSQTQKTLPLWRQIGWAAGDTAINLYWGMLNTFLFFFYTEIMGISPVSAGIAFAIASVWDGVTDPVMGSIVDRIRSRYGRFRPYILFFSVPCAISFVLMFWAPPIEGAWLIAYATATHILFRTFFTAISVPFSSLAAVLSPDSNTRSWLASLRIMFAAIGGLVVAFTIPKLLESFVDQNLAFFIAALGLAIAATSILLVTFFATRGADDLAPPSIRAEISLLRQFVADLRSFWEILLKNRPLAVIFGAVTFTSILTGMNGKALIYWTKYDLGDLSVLSWVLPLGAIVVIVFSPFWARLAQHTSKRAVMWIGAALTIVSFTAFYFLNPRDHFTLATTTIIGAAGVGAKFVMYWSMLPDTVEYNAMKTGSRSDAKIFGFAGLAQKLSIAVNAAIFGYLLSETGFVADQEQADQTKDAILSIMCVIPIIGAILSSLLMLAYPIDAKFHAEIRAKIAAATA